MCDSLIPDFHFQILKMKREDVLIESTGVIGQRIKKVKIDRFVSHLCVLVMLIFIVSCTIVTFDDGICRMHF